MIHNGLRSHTDLRDELLLAGTLGDMEGVVGKLADRGWEQPAFHTANVRPELSWYRRHRTAEEESQATRGEGTSRGGGSPGAEARREAAITTGVKLRLEGAAGGESSNAEVARAALEKRAKKKADRKRRNANRAAGGSRRQRKAQQRQDNLQGGAQEALLG